MAVAGLWLLDLYFAGAFVGCVAFPVLDFWQVSSWQENLNLVPFRQIAQYLLCLVPGQGYLNGSGYAFRGHFVFWMNFLCFPCQFFCCHASHPAGVGRVPPSGFAVVGGCVIEVTQLFVRTDTAPFRFDVDAIILRVAGAVVLVGRQDTRCQKMLVRCCFSRRGGIHPLPGTLRRAQDCPERSRPPLQPAVLGSP